MTIGVIVGQRSGERSAANLLRLFDLATGGCYNRLDPPRGVALVLREEDPHVPSRV